MKNKKTGIAFINGAISPDFIAGSIARHGEKKEIGAHSIFLGQVRADRIKGKTVKAIEYTTYEEMANHQMMLIRKDIFQQYALTCMHVYHSLGRVETGEICLFVFASAPHRNVAIDACEETVERMKRELPVWGREILTNETHQWKKDNWGE
jgi:molybdopterin synthase catalytic subunit